MSSAATNTTADFIVLHTGSESTFSLRRSTPCHCQLWLLGNQMDLIDAYAAQMYRLGSLSRLVRAYMALRISLSAKNGA